MSLVLRIILAVGLIFSLSPLRPSSNRNPDELAVADLDGVGALIKTLDPLRAGARAKAVESLAVMSAEIPGVGPDVMRKAVPERNAPRSAEGR